VIYPFPIVVNLMLQTKREKFGLGALFAMGFITIGVSIGRFITMIYVDNSISICESISCSPLYRSFASLEG